MSITGGTALVTNNTLVDRHGNLASAVSVYSGSVQLFNNIVTSHTAAIQQFGGSVQEDYNLFFGLAATLSGTVSSGGHSHTADPRFVDAQSSDFHLRLNSTAIDAGDNNQRSPSFPTDLAGGPRFADVPSVPDTGAGGAPIVDIGAYEVNNRLFLPLVQR